MQTKIVLRIFISYRPLPAVLVGLALQARLEPARFYVVWICLLVATTPGAELGRRGSKKQRTKTGRKENCETKPIAG